MINFEEWQALGKRAVEAIKALKRNEIVVQVNTTVTQQNYSQIGDVFALAEKLGAENFHLFFLVPTGRGARIEDITPDMYEKIITSSFSKSMQYNLNVKAVLCTPVHAHCTRNWNWHDPLGQRLHAGYITVASTLLEKLHLVPIFRLLWVTSAKNPSRTYGSTQRFFETCETSRNWKANAVNVSIMRFVVVAELGLMVLLAIS